MPKCPTCGRAMASVLKREGGMVRMYYECHACPSSTGEPGEVKAADPAPPKDQ